MPFLTAPWFLLGLTSLGALAGIYWLRNRFRRRTVSSLMLWENQRQVREGGRRLSRIQTPWLFFLELAVLALLALAAAGPMLLSRQSTRPLVVVLDDSYSMLAGPDQTPRQRAFDALLKEFRSDSAYTLRFVLAGSSPNVLGRPVHAESEVRSLLDQWTCRAPAADLPKAVALASEIAGPAGRLLVLSDHLAPDGLRTDGRLLWWSFGELTPNVALVNALRSSGDASAAGPAPSPDRCLLEIANFGRTDARRTLVIRSLDDNQVLKRENLLLKPDEVRRLIFALPAGTPAIVAELDPDALTIDDRAWLLPDPDRSVSVRIQMADTELADALRHALQATRRADFQRRPPELLFTDSPPPRPVAGAWTIRFLPAPDPVAYAGPFIVDASHPLTRGLALDGTVWGANRTPTLTGRPLIAVDQVPLLADTERSDGAHDVRLSFASSLSTLHHAVDWPVLIWNALDWRSQNLPGLRHTNLRLGQDETLVLPEGVSGVLVRGAEGRPRELPVFAGTLSLPAAEVGRFVVEPVWKPLDDGKEPEHPEVAWAFAVSALSADESNLGASASERQGDWTRAESLRHDYRSIAWVLLLAALALLLIHQVHLTSSRRRTAP